MSTEGQLASLGTNVSNLNQRLTDHTALDDVNFGKLSDQLVTLDEKLDELLLREARREGEVRGARKSAIAIAAIVSSVISALSFAAPYIVGG